MEPMAGSSEKSACCNLVNFLFVVLPAAELNARAALGLRYDSRRNTQDHPRDAECASAAPLPFRVRPENNGKSWL